MTFEIIKGDLFDPSHKFDGLAQGVNTFGVMGAGIAVPFRTKWPEMYESYKDLCKRHGETLAGLIHIWSPEFEVSVTEKGLILNLDNGVTIFNLFTQIAPGANADYTLLRRSLILLRQAAENDGLLRIGLPWIGCGIGGLERHNVQHLLHAILHDSEVEFVLVEQE